jgi:hypothetical protein
MIDDFEKWLRNGSICYSNQEEPWNCLSDSGTVYIGSIELMAFGLFVV